MKRENHSVSVKDISKKLAFTALFAALCCVGTLFIAVPLPNGYFNVGDVFVLLAGWCMGPLFGAAAAGLGSCLADILNGFALYAPATFLIKALDAAAAYLLWRAMRLAVKKDGFDVFARGVAAVGGELLMVLGYFAFECLLYGAAGAAASLAGNAVQGGACTVLGVALVAVLYHLKSVRGFFSPLAVPARLGASHAVKAQK